MPDRETRAALRSTFLAAALIGASMGLSRTAHATQLGGWMVSAGKSLGGGALLCGLIACFVGTQSGCTAGRAGSSGHEPPSVRPTETPPAPGAETFVLDEPTAFEAARRLTMRSEYGIHDCDCNGVPDSIDVREGRSRDVNHNGQDDMYDDDPAVRDLSWTEDWRRLAAARDTSAFLVGHTCEHEVWIVYTVPQGGADVRLTVRAPSGHVVRTLLRRHVDSGAYDLVWDETNDHGRPVPDGTYYAIRLEIGRRVYVRSVFWRRRS